MLYIKNLEKNIGIRNLFKIEELIINENDKVALIGENGIGKTTLFRIILRLDKDYSGDVVLDGKIDFLLNNIIESNGYYKDSSLEYLIKNKNVYSPGELQKLRLGKLLSNNCFLMIDEPTSHLDITQKEKLIEMLNKRSKGFFLISHDRDFINRICNKIIELSDNSIEIYNGDYEVYLIEREKRLKFRYKEYDNYIKEKKRLEKVELKIIKQCANIRTTPKRMGNSEARLHKMGGQGNKKKLDKQINSVRTRIEHLDVKSRPKDDFIIKLDIPEEEKIHSKILIKAENLNKSFTGKIIFKDANFEIYNESKIALLGDNGTGKTTFINMILNRENIWVHPNLKIGYYSQMDEIINAHKTILENLLISTIYSESLTRIVLARLGFKNDDVFKKFSVLSDGEKAKVKLAKLLTSSFNFLIFDELTNFLDINSIEVFEKLLKGYDRAFLFITHDVKFINNIASSLLIIKNNKIISFNGNLIEYNKSLKKSKLNKNEDILIDFKLSQIASKLSMEISLDEKSKLEKEYNKLLKYKNNK